MERRNKTLDYRSPLIIWIVRFDRKKKSNRKKEEAIGEGDSNEGEMRTLKIMRGRKKGERGGMRRSKRWIDYHAKKSESDEEWRGKMETAFVLPLSFFLPFPFSLFPFSGYLPIDWLKVFSTVTFRSCDWTSEPAQRDFDACARS